MAGAVALPTPGRRPPAARPAAIRSAWPEAIRATCSARQPRLQRQTQLRGRGDAGQPVGRVGGKHDLARRHKREQRQQVLGDPPGGVEQHVGKIDARAPDPREIGDGGMGEDHAGVGVVARVADHVLAQRRDPAPGVDQDRERALVREREQPRHVRVVERELLGARMQLDAAAPWRERPLGLGQRPLARLDPAERHHQAVAGRRRLDHEVVGRRVAVRLVHRKDEAATGSAHAQAVQAAPPGSGCIPSGSFSPRCVCASNSSRPGT